MPRPRPSKLVAFSHFMAAVAVFSKGIAKADDLSHNWPLVALFCSFGVLILLFALFHERIERASLLVSVLESIVLVAAGVSSLQHGQRLLPYAWFLAAALTVVAAVIQLLALRHERARAAATPPTP
jgi:hypothetical protein